MSESGIRRMVHNAYEQEAAVHCDVGLYADERIRNFFAQVKTIMNETFHSLHDSLQQYPPPERAKRLAKGLAFLASEHNQSMSQDEIARATQEFPTISHEYKRAMMRYAQCMVSARKSSNIKVECTPFDSFLFKMYKRMATCTEVRSGRYFTMSYMEQEIFLKDVMRMTMGGCLTVKQVEEDARSSTARGERSERSERSEAPHSTVARKPVLPSDSVSNIMPNMTGTMAGGAGREKARTTALENALSVATQDDEAEPSITVFSLTDHKQRLAQREQQRDQERERRGKDAKPFTTPSIVASRRHVGDSHIEKEVEIETHSRAPPGGPHGTGRTTGGGGVGGAAKPAYSTFFDTTQGSPRGGGRVPADGNASDFMFEDDTSSSD